MKRAWILTLIACLICASLSACAGTIYPYSDGYSHVSTTDNGYVNGTNDRGMNRTDSYGTTGQNGMGSAANGSTGYNAYGTYGADGYNRWNGTNGSAANGYNDRGTGMNRTR